MSYLKIQKLEKTFNGNKILKGIDLNIEKGEFISLLGASGSGKTTLLRCISGLEKPDQNQGSIFLNGKTLSSQEIFIDPSKRNFGMVFQSYAVWPHMTVFENVKFPLAIKKIEQADKKVNQVLELVKMSHLKTRFPHELSGGQQQRVALARALVTSPDLLLLDEPLSNLDALLRDELGAEIRRLQKELNLTTILVTHDQKEALSLSDRIVLLEEGIINCQGTPETLYHEPPTPFAAHFLAGGQSIKGKNQVFLPRKWKLKSPSSGEYVVKVRIFLGSEYEYRVVLQGDQEQIRFFSTEKLDIESRIQLTYSP